ncbi:MAG TPA: Bax inhibitor-1/YccA family protein [Gemmatimonadaceae bacterium]|nr:Bax inhibitor-1/YccA family protein [Gemmatimonadaceae bacterium]
MGFSRYSTLPATGIVRTGEERATLVRRTYTLVLASVVVTMVGTWFGLSQPAVLQTVAAHPIITMLLAFVPLIMAQRARDRFPQNIALVFLFTFVMGVAIAPTVFVLNTRQPGVVGQAALLTLSTFGVLTAYAWTSRRDFSAWGGFFIVGVWVIIGTSLLNLFFQNQTAYLWIAGATVLVFSGLLVFDTWRLRNAYGPGDYVLAAVNIYLDLLNMFLAILQLLGGGRRN